jgi:hypothetical protein
LTWPQAYGDMDLHFVGPGGTLGEMSPEDGDLFYPYSQASACGTATPTSKYPGGCAGGCGTDICIPAGTGCTLDWGQSAECLPDQTNADDGVFEVDQLFGYGPEQVTYSAPFDGTYTVTAVYYAYDSCTGTSGTSATTAVIDIDVNGSLAWSGSMPNMAICDAWDAAQVVVANNGTSITVNPLTTPVYSVLSNPNGVCGGG